MQRGLPSVPGSDHTTMMSGPLASGVSEVDGSGCCSSAALCSSALDGRVGNCRHQRHILSKDTVVVANRVSVRRSASQNIPHLLFICIPEKKPVRGSRHISSARRTAGYLHISPCTCAEQICVVALAQRCMAHKNPSKKRQHTADHRMPTVHARK